MPGMTVIMVNAVGTCLAALGAVGALLAAWQLGVWWFSGAFPVPAPVWAHTGVAGRYLLDFFRALPLVLLLAFILQLFICVLGLALFWRRSWARRTAIAFAFAWAGLGGVLWGLMRFALNDLEHGYPEHAAFAQGLRYYTTQITLLNVAVSAGLVLLMIQPSVRAQFRR
jgi:hypothetical protein